MGKFLQGLFVGTAIGILVAPEKGEELRDQIMTRFKQIQSKLPKNSFLDNTTQPQFYDTSQTAKDQNGETITPPSSRPANTATTPGNTMASMATPSPLTSSPSKPTTPTTSSTTNAMDSSANIPASPPKPTTFSNAPTAPLSSVQNRPFMSNTTSPSTTSDKPTEGAAQPKRYAYESTTADEDNEPISLPVETFEHPKPTNPPTPTKDTSEQNKRTTNSNLNNNTNTDGKLNR